MVHANISQFASALDCIFQNYCSGSCDNSKNTIFLFLLFSGVRRPPRLVSGHLKGKYLCYLYQIWYWDCFW